MDGSFMRRANFRPLIWWAIIGMVLMAALFVVGIWAVVVGIWVMVLWLMQHVVL